MTGVACRRAVSTGFANGKSQSVTVTDAPADAARRLGQAVRFAAKVWKHGWGAEWAIPFELLGLKPVPGEKIPLNLGAFRSERQERHCWAGTLGENWQLDQAGVLKFK